MKPDDTLGEPKNAHEDGSMNPYRQRVLSMMRELLAPHGAQAAALDFGSGDGWFAQQMLAHGVVTALTPLDVKRRQTVCMEPVIYAGGVVPYTDGQFDLVYSVDVLHHCPNPCEQLVDIARCSSHFLLIKDHTYSTPVGYAALAVLDELGNRKFGIPSPYRYQRRWEWHDVLVSRGWTRVGLTYPAKCHVGLLGALTNSLQFVALYERQ